MLAGPVALALVGLWVVYLVPQVTRRRQQLVDSRTDDRFSSALRVVRTTPRGRGRSSAPGPRRPRTGPVGCAHAGSTAGLLTPGHGQRTARPDDPAGSSSSGGGTAVDRPLAAGAAAGSTRAAARARAAFAAATARRAAAARRRGVLAAVLLAAAAGGWVAWAIVPRVLVYAGVVPSVLLVAVVALGRRAVVTGRRHDAQWRAAIATAEQTGATVPAARPAPAVPAARPAPAAVPARPPAAATTTPAADVPAPPARRPARAPRTAAGPTHQGASLDTTVIRTGATVLGKAVRPSEAMTDVFAAIVADRGETGATARHASGPVPVVPAGADARTHVHPAAPELTHAQRIIADPDATAAHPTPVQAAVDGGWTPVPVPPPAYVLKPAAPHREPVALTDLEADGAAAPVPAAAVAPVVEPTTSASLDLDAILERRRASGQ